MHVAPHAEEPLVVVVGERLVEGWLLEPGCAVCGGPRVYFLAYDAVCCPTCNVWIELRCPEPDCVHCRSRPDRPWPGASPGGLAQGGSRSAAATGP